MRLSAREASGDCLFLITRACLGFPSSQVMCPLLHEINLAAFGNLTTAPRQPSLCLKGGVTLLFTLDDGGVSEIAFCVELESQTSLEGGQTHLRAHERHEQTN